MLNKQILAILILAALVLSVAVLAQPNFVATEVIKGNANPAVTIPAHAAQLAPGVFDLGTTVVNGEVIQGYMFVDYIKGFSHKPNHKPGGGNGSTSTCFSLLAQGAKWKTIEPWVVNTANNAGLDGTFVFTNLAADIQKWETAAGKNILGNGSTTTNTLVADTVSPDNVNEVYFTDVSSPGAIAVTIVWGIFTGPPSQRKLIEWDQVYDDVDFTWSSTGVAGKMDFENIATHELGHSKGMGHPPDECTEETMYRFAALGETKKRDLHIGDIAGIKQLYG